VVVLRRGEHDSPTLYNSSIDGRPAIRILAMKPTKSRR
jgi:hypothetical protein